MPTGARRGPATRGTAFVVYEDIYDAKNAVDHLSGFNVCGRYLIVLYFQAARMAKRAVGCGRDLEASAMGSGARGEAGAAGCARGIAVAPRRPRYSR